MHSPKLLLTVAFLVLASAAAAKDTVVHGTIDTLDPEVGVVVLRLPPQFEPKSFNLAKPDLPVTNALGRPLKLADLEARDRVALMVNAQGDVAAIRLDADCLWGSLLDFDPKERQVQVKFGSSRRTFSLSKDAVVLAEGSPFDPAELKPGQGLKAIVSSDGKHVLQIHVGKGISSASPYGKYLHQSGVLVKADHDRKVLHIVTMPKEYQYKELEYETWAEVRLLYAADVVRVAGIATLQPYCKVNCHMEADTNKIVQVTAEPPTFIRRRVEKVERGERRLTLRLENKPVTLPVAADAMVRTVQGTSSWDSIAEGALVTCCLSFDGREVVYLYVWSK